MSSQVLKQNQMLPFDFVTCGCLTTATAVRATICVRLQPSLPEIKPGTYAQALTVFDDTDNSASQIYLPGLLTRTFAASAAN